MVNERDEKYEGHEEGEYHFSDDMGNYDEMETEAPKVAPSPAQKLSPQDAVAKLSQYKRMIISVVAFFGLIFLVYKMLTPTSTPPTTEFTTTATAKPIAAPKAPKPLVPIAPPTQTTTPAPEQSPTPQPPQVAQAQPQQPQQSMPMPSIPIPNPMEQVGQAPPASPIPTAPAAPARAASVPVIQSTPLANVPAPPMLEQQQQQSAAASAASAAETEAVAEQNKVIMDKLASLEDENSKLVNMIQTQFAQKMADMQTENNEAQEKVHALNKRLSNIEASMNKMAQILQDEGFVTKTPMAQGAPGIPATTAQQPRIGYTVQAIIPGRAWLKSDSGDTVTVAEGDILKDYGRVTKIDPYDGVVNIDTGNRILVLSYGAGND